MNFRTYPEELPLPLTSSTSEETREFTEVTSATGGTFSPHLQVMLEREYNIGSFSFRRGIVETQPSPIVKEELEEVPISMLIESLTIDEEAFNGEIKLYLAKYGIPSEYVEEFKKRITERLVADLRKRNLPTEDWLVKPLLRFFTRLAIKLTPI